MTGPLLITGMYRTGSTLLSRVLNQHPYLCISYDRANFFRFYLDYDGPIQSAYRKILAEAQERFEARWDERVPVERIADRIEEDRPVTFAKVYRHFMERTFCTDADEDVRWGEKTLLQWRNIPLFLQMFPDGQVLHVHRDPRAIVASQREITWEEPHRYLDAIFACLDSLQWYLSTGHALSPHAYRTVRYEDLVRDPEGFAREITEFLGLDYDARMVDTSRFETGSGGDWEPNSGFDDIEGEGFSTRGIDRWKETLEAWEVGLIESLLSAPMAHFGYEPSRTELTSADLTEIWRKFQETPLLQRRLIRWFDTGGGVDRYPSDPRNPTNWSKHDFE